MARYLLSLYQPSARPRRPSSWSRSCATLAALNEEMRAAGAWVFAGGLHPPTHGHRCPRAGR